MYETALLLHILGAFLLGAGALVAGILFEAARRRRSPAEIGLLLGLTRLGALFVAIGTLLVALSGVWLLDLSAWTLGTDWIALGSGLFAAVLVLGAFGGQRPKRARKLATRLAHEGAEETDELRALLDDPLARAGNYLSALLLLAVIGVMVVKPTF